MTIETQIDTHTLALAIEANREAQAELRAAATDMEAILFARIRESGGTALIDDDFKIVIDTGTPTYDLDVLKPLLEELPFDDLRKAYSEATTKTVDVPEKWHGLQLNRIERAYGAEIADRIRAARILGTERLVVERKKTPAAPPLAS